MVRTLSINRLIVIACAAGFLFLAVDTLLEHIESFGPEPLSWVPVAFSVLGFAVVAVAALRWGERWVRLAHWCFLLALAVGALGLVLHVADRFESEEELVAEHGAAAKEHKPPPVLPPLSFCGLGVIGLIGTLRRWPAETRP